MTQYERHPLSAEYADLEGEAWECFLDGFSNYGFLDKPIVRHDGKILDGWQRYRACTTLGIQPTFQGMPEGISPEEYVRLVNDERRHESAAAKAKRVADRRERVAAARVEGKSLRTIAEEEGVSHIQVREDLKAASGVNPLTPETKPTQDTPATPAKVTGKDGKSYPATAPKAERNGKHTGNGKANPDADDAPTVPKVEPMDALGNPIPKGLRDTFAGNTQALENAVKMLQEVKRTAKGLQKWNAWVRPSEIEEKLSELIEDFKNGLPYAVCDDCKGKGCSACRQEGWLTRWRYEESAA